jgi:hypothetical protein
MISFVLDRGKVVHGLASTGFTGTTPHDTAAIDRLGFNSALIILNYSAGTSGTITPTFYDGATSSPADAVTLETAAAAINVASAGSTIMQVDLSGFNRYFKVTLTPALGGNTSNITATVILFDAVSDPGSGTAVTPLRKA